MSKANHWALMIFCQIFRCWAVYNESWRIIALPFLLLLYNIAYLVIQTFGSWFDINNFTGSGSAAANIGLQIASVVSSYFGVTIAINIYATCK